MASRPRGRTRELETQANQWTDDQAFCLGMSRYHPFGQPKTRWIDRLTGDPVARFECKCGVERVTMFPRRRKPIHKYKRPEGYGTPGFGRLDEKDRAVIRDHAVDRILAGVPEVDPEEPVQAPVPITSARSKRRKAATRTTATRRAAANG